MDLVHSFLNLIVPPTAFLSICFFLPPFLFFKFLLYVLRLLFSENVAGKVVLITGASSGIGEHLAYEYARRGSRLVLVARRENSLRDVAERALDLGSPDVLPVPADVSKVDDCKRVVDEAIAHFGRLDHLVNNAGVVSACLFEDAGDITNFRPVMDMNFWGSVHMSYFAAPYLKSSRGRIVAVASSAAWLPTPWLSFYNASKAAVVSLYETLRVEFGPEIRITIVTPGLNESEINQGKFLVKEGKMDLDPTMRDVIVGALPVVSAGKCAKAIVNSACRGQRRLTEPAWFRASYYMGVFFPEVLEWCCRVLLMTSPEASHADAASKKILDFTGAKKLLYPPSILSPLLKAD